MYLLCCILHIFKNKDMSSTVAAALFHQPGYPDRKQGTPSGYISKHNNCISDNECSSASTDEQSDKLKPDCLSAILNDCLSPSDCCQGNTPRNATVAECAFSLHILAL
jgi:protein CLEC16A